MATMLTRTRFIVVLGVVGTLLACGSDGTSGNTANPTPSTPPTTIISIAPLDSMLDVSDVGAGWQVGPPVTDADFSDSIQIPCTEVALNPTIIERLTPNSGFQFEPTDSSYKHIIELLVTGEPQQLEGDLQAYFEAMEGCEATSSTTTGTGTRVEQFTIPDLGDQRAAYVLTATASPDATWHVRDARVRVGSIAIQLGLAEILPTPQDEPSVTDAEFVQLLQTAVAKLEG